MLKYTEGIPNVEMARAEMDAMKVLEDEENFNPTKQSRISSQRFQERSELNLNATPFVPKEFTTPLKPKQPHLPTLEFVLPKTLLVCHHQHRPKCLSSQKWK